MNVLKRGILGVFAVFLFAACEEKEIYPDTGGHVEYSYTTGEVTRVQPLCQDNGPCERDGSLVLIQITTGGCTSLSDFTYNVDLATRTIEVSAITSHPVGENLICPAIANIDDRALFAYDIEPPFNVIFKNTRLEVLVDDYNTWTNSWLASQEDFCIIIK